MIWYILLFLLIFLIRPFVENVTVSRTLSERKKVQFYREQFLAYLVVLVVFIFIVTRFHIPLVELGWKGVYLDTVRESKAFPSLVKFLLMVGFVFFILLSFGIQWMKDHGESIFEKEELPKSVEVTFPDTLKEKQWWFAFVGLSSIVEGVVYVPYCIYFFVHVLHIHNSWLLSLGTAVVYFSSQLAFKRDRLSIQTFLVGAYLAGVYIVTESVLILVLFFALSFLVYDVYQQDRELKAAS
ncbi:hypothetical protein [Priestia koreensis]|uniref:hypothetical protein n=1 Tax=Priestia koreensis TaxID=284581 RepID=UPI001F589CFC|nr:hypothetical protein [Priestia koreensis]MCM3006215.1 hypothetical protein [Priestia koreensis]UNL87069.1 hypothetical protein IE339_11545 [Priestia koreensis]